jgi:FeS assembly SUF system protein
MADSAPPVADPLQTLALKPLVIDALHTVFDPEIPVNVYELGLIYDVVVDAEARVHVRMTLTSPACPSAQQIPVEVREKVQAIPGVKDAIVEVVWDPPWSMDLMSDVARLQLGLM